MHQVNILFAAIHYYKKVLDAPAMVGTRDEGVDGGGPDRRVHDLTPLAAHNLAVIYQNSGNLVLARDILKKYCTV